MNNTRWLRDPAIWFTGSILLIYLITLTPGLPPIDAGEFIGAASTFGLPHPTGYPLYLIVARLFAMFPLSPVLSLSALSAIASAFAIFFLIRASREQTGITGVSWLFAGVFAFSATLWNSAIRPEVYSFNLLFLSAAFWLGLRIWQGKTDHREPVLFAFFSGCAAVTHLSSGYFLLPLWVGLLLRSSTRKVIMRPSLLLPLLLPATSHLILPLRELFGRPLYTWGDMSTLDGWWRHVSGWQYRVWLFESSEVWQKNFVGFWKQAGHDTGWIGLAVAALGLFRLWRCEWQRGLWLTSIFLFPVIMVSGYSIPDIEAYYLPSLLIVGFFLINGAHELLTMLPKRQVQYAISGIVLLLVAIFHFPTDTRNEDRNQLTYSKALLSQLPSPAVLFSSDWEVVVGPLEGLFAMGERPDVAVIDVELLRRSWYVELLFRRYPRVISGCETELNELIPALRKFERNEEISAETLEFLYRRAISALMIKNVPRSAVCFMPEVQAPLKAGQTPLFAIPLPLFSRLTSQEIDYVSDLTTLPIDAMYERTADTRIDGRIREKIASTLVQRAGFLFRQQARLEAFEAIRLAKRLNPPPNSQVWTMIEMLEREQGQRDR
ncbi:MAG: DUF2723 domain-containing protein [bacterium]|nr:DUF2723 domain-containing protein [bacterium]